MPFEETNLDDIGVLRILRYKVNNNRYNHHQLEALLRALQIRARQMRDYPYQFSDDYKQSLRQLIIEIINQLNLH